MTDTFVILGNMNVGKTSLFSQLSQVNGTAINIPGTTMSVKSGRIKGMDARILDTPGIYSIFSLNEDDRASRDLLLMDGIRTRIHGLILVADAKNLKRSIAGALQYAEYGLPMVLVVNMVDESASRGIAIDTQKLAQMTGLPVTTTIANEGVGVEKLKPLLRQAAPTTSQVTFPREIQSFIDLVDRLITTDCPVSKRILALLLLAGDPCASAYVAETCGQTLLNQVDALARECRTLGPYALDILFENLYHKAAEKIVSQVQTVTPPTRHPLIMSIGDWATRLSTGIPIALAVVALTYLFVGSFAATFLVDTLNRILFQGVLIPFFTTLTQAIPSPFLQDLIMDPDFGILPTGIFLALGLVLPVIFCFYTAFGILEDSGYLPRLSILLDRVFKKLGLNGKGVIPLVMGFSCITMALLTTRMLSSEKERNIAAFLVFLCMPCAPLLAVMLIILEGLPFSATLAVFGTLAAQVLIAGYFANKILPGRRAAMIMEIPAMRIPKPGTVVKMAARKSFHFMKEAIPVFIFASVLVFLFQRAGGLEFLETSLGPVIDRILGLPEKSIQVFIKTMIRREIGATELQHLAGGYSHLQLVVNLLVMTLIAPCINAVIVLFKERGIKAASAILATTLIYAVAVGSTVNTLCRLLGITFT